MIYHYLTDPWVSDLLPDRSIANNLKYIEWLRENAGAYPVTVTGTKRGGPKASGRWKRLKDRMGLYYDERNHHHGFGYAPYQLRAAVVDVDAGDVEHLARLWPNAVWFIYRDGRAHGWFRFDRFDMNKRDWEVGHESGQIIAVGNYIIIRYAAILPRLYQMMTRHDSPITHIDEFITWLNHNDNPLTAPSPSTEVHNILIDIPCDENQQCNILCTSVLGDGITEDPDPDDDFYRDASPTGKPGYQYNDLVTLGSDFTDDGRRRGMHKLIWQYICGNAYIGYADRGDDPDDDATFIFNAQEWLYNQWLDIPYREDLITWDACNREIIRAIGIIYPKWGCVPRTPDGRSAHAKRNQAKGNNVKYMNSWERDRTLYVNTQLLGDVKTAAMKGNVPLSTAYRAYKRLTALVNDGKWDGESDLCPYELVLPSLQEALDKLKLS